MINNIKSINNNLTIEVQKINYDNNEQINKMKENIDELFLNDDYPQEVYNSKKINDTINLDTCHWGQRKLLLNEIYFISNYGKNINNIIYVGAAAGFHIQLLSKMFKTGQDPHLLIKEEKWVQVSDPNSLKELAEKIIKLTKSKSQIVYKELPVDDPKQRCPNISLAKEKLSWSPKINVDEGLQKTIENFRFRLK